MSVQDFTFAARDGFELHATRFESTSTTSNGRAVLVASATAVPRGFYRHLAADLAAQGHDVVTFDYRGIGDSRPSSLRGFDARMRDWALLDMAAAVDWVQEQLQPRKLFVWGHSVGGQVAGLLDNADAIDGMATFSSQSGYWRLQGQEQVAMVGFHMHLTFPFFTSTLGYVPMSKFGGGEDLPKGVAREWSRWCRHPNYLLGDTTLPLQRYQSFKAPVLAYSFDDDKWGTARSVDAMMKAYPHLVRRHVLPRDIGLQQLGHFGAFRKDASVLWRQTVEWIDTVDPL